MSRAAAPPRDPLARAVRLLARVRVVLYALALAALVYLAWRFDVVSLPEEGCSPLRAFAPGDRLVVDRRPGRLGEGDAVLYRDPADTLLLGAVAAPPEDAGAEVRAELGAGALWIRADDPSCPSPDSRALGPVPRDRVAARVLLGL